MTPLSTSPFAPYWHDIAQQLDAIGKFSVKSNIYQPACETLYQHLIDTNAHTNLTRITDAHGFLYQHLLDSLLVSPYIPLNATVMDIGSGAGFPALPLALFRPDLTLTAVETVGKKASFIESTGQALKLSNLSVLSERAEALGQDPAYRETYDIVCARALAPTNVLLELCTPLLKVGGQFITWKTHGSFDAELAQAQHSLETLNITRTATHPVPNTLDTTPIKDTIIVMFDKAAPTPPAYPRKAGMPKKRPL